MRSFDLVDFKVLEAEFFLEKISRELPDPIIIRFYFSAYTSAARSITFSLQAVMKGVPEFDKWYESKQEILKKDKLAKFFVQARNISQKVGVAPIYGGSMKKNDDGKLVVKYFFGRDHPDFKDLPESDVATACKDNFSTLLLLIHECYVKFGVVIDPHQYYTKANFEHLKLTIDDLDEEIVGVRGWSYVNGWPEEYRWQSHRNQISGCRLDLLFLQYLGVEKPTPPQLPENKDDFDGKSWIPPALKNSV